MCFADAKRDTTPPPPTAPSGPARRARWGGRERRVRSFFILLPRSRRGQGKTGREHARDGVPDGPQGVVAVVARETARRYARRSAASKRRPRNSVGARAWSKRSRWRWRGVRDVRAAAQTFPRASRVNVQRPRPTVRRAAANALGVAVARYLSCSRSSRVRPATTRARATSEGARGGAQRPHRPRASRGAGRSSSSSAGMACTSRRTAPTRWRQTSSPTSESKAVSAARRPHVPPRACSSRNVSSAAGRARSSRAPPVDEARGGGGGEDFSLKTFLCAAGASPHGDRLAARRFHLRAPRRAPRRGPSRSSPGARRRRRRPSGRTTASSPVALVLSAPAGTRARAGESAKASPPRERRRVRRAKRGVLRGRAVAHRRRTRSRRRRVSGHGSAAPGDCAVR